MGGFLLLLSLGVFFCLFFVNLGVFVLVLFFKLIFVNAFNEVHFT